MSSRPAPISFQPPQPGVDGLLRGDSGNPCHSRLPQPQVKVSGARTVKHRDEWLTFQLTDWIPNLIWAIPRDSRRRATHDAA